MDVGGIDLVVSKGGRLMLHIEKVVVVVVVVVVVKVLVMRGGVALVVEQIVLAAEIGGNVNESKIKMIPPPLSLTANLQYEQRNINFKR